ncbi:MAG TPA: DUF2232 domain-containing protein [Thermoanaerobaculia bacterium]|nr:DUF2232 domain-containing protein [Thermoanaerobaculia bacterium]
MTAAAPPFGLVLAPHAAARLGRAALESQRLATGFVLPALTVPIALLLGALLVPEGAVVAAVLAIALVALPAVALFAAARDGRRRDDVLLVVFALTGIGGLAALLGVSVATGRDPGAILASRWAALVPEMLANYRSSGWSETSLATVARLFEFARVLVEEQIAGLVLAVAVLHAALVVYGFARGAGLAEADWSEASFSRFRTPLAAAAAFVPAGLLAAVGGAELRRPAIDLLLPLGVLFFLRGLAIIRALLDRGRAGLVGRALVYVLVFQMPFPLLLALSGLFDEFVDVRTRLEKRRPGGESAGPPGPDGF